MTPTLTILEEPCIPARPLSRHLIVRAHLNLLLVGILGRIYGYLTSGSSRMPDRADTRGRDVSRSLLREPLKVLGLARYGPLAASARYRFYDMREHLKSRGIDLDVRSLLPDAYVASLKVGGIAGATVIGASYARRVAQMLCAPQWDMLYVHYEALPYIPVAVESLLLASGRPYVLDYDDAWFHRYDAHPSRLVRKMFSLKVRHLMERAAGVVVGSRYLYEYAERFNTRVVLAPTSIDLSRYPKEPRRRDVSRPLTIGWIGSPSTTAYLEPIRDALSTVVARTGARLRVIGAGRGLEGISGLEAHPWNSSTEVSLLNEIDIGIMPVPDGPFARGKCAFKLIQYMGCWKAVVASPVGENKFVVTPGVTGFLAANAHDWVQALTALLDRPELAAQFGRAGRQRVEKDYTMSHAAGTLSQFLRECAVLR